MVIILFDRPFPAWDLETGRQATQCVSGFEKGDLPAGARQALDDFAFRGGLDLDVTLTRPGDPKEPTSYFGTVTLHGCAFRRSYAFEQVSGDVQLDGRVGPDGAHDLTASPRLHKLVVKGLPLTGIRGRLVYHRGGEGEKQGSAHLTVSLPNEKARSTTMVFSSSDTMDSA